MVNLFHIYVHTYMYTPLSFSCEQNRIRYKEGLLAPSSLHKISPQKQYVRIYRIAKHFAR